MSMTADDARARSHLSPLLGETELAIQKIEMKIIEATSGGHFNTCVGGLEEDNNVKNQFTQLGFDVSYTANHYYLKWK